MCFLDLIEQHHRVRFSPDSLGKLTTLIVTNISRRRSDQSGYGVFLHILTHIDPNHIRFIIEQSCCKRFGQFRFSDTGRSQEQERTDGLRRILDPGLGTDNGLRYLGHTLILTDDSLMKLVCQMERLIPLALVELCHRNSGPAGNDPCDLILGNGLMNQRQILAFDLLFLDLQLFLQLRQFAVTDPSGFFQFVVPLCDFRLAVQIIDLLTKLPKLLHRILFVIPLCLLLAELFLQISQFFLKRRQTLPAQIICFFFQRCFLDLQLRHLSGQFIQLGRHGIQLGLNEGARLIHQVNGLIRQKPIGNIAVGKHRRAYQRRVSDLYAVIYFIAVF